MKNKTSGAKNDTTSGTPLVIPGITKVNFVGLRSSILVINGVYEQKPKNPKTKNATGFLGRANPGGMG